MLLMTPEEIEKQILETKEFIIDFGKSRTLDKDLKRFLKIFLVIMVIVTIIILNKLFFYLSLNPDQFKNNFYEKESYKRYLKLTYQEELKKEKPKIKKIEILENNVRVPKKKLKTLAAENRSKAMRFVTEGGLIYEVTTSDMDQSIINELNLFAESVEIPELVSENDLDNILSNFVKDFNNDRLNDSRITGKKGYFIVPEVILQLKEIAITGKRRLKFDFGKIDKEETIKSGYRSVTEISQYHKILKSNEQLILSCVTNYIQKNINTKQLRGSFSFQFNINAKGKIVKESVKLLEENVKDKDLIECVIKRIKLISGFLPASSPDAADFVMQKKWAF
jgi:hypothetical protein